MGFGDYILLSGKLRTLKKELPSVQFTAQTLEDRFFFASVFRNNPYLTPLNQFDRSKPWFDLTQVQTGTRDTTSSRIVWDNTLDPVRGDLFFDEGEMAWACRTLEEIRNPHKFKGRVVFISPIATAARRVNGQLVVYEHKVNKEWPRAHWENLISKRPRERFVVTGPTEYRDQAPIGAQFIECDFRHACALMSLCDLYLGIEGGFHHAAAALRVPGIVIFGHWISPAITGYGAHLNLHSGLSESNGCGSLTRCPVCQSWLEDLSPLQVSRLMDQLWS